MLSRPCMLGWMVATGWALIGCTRPPVAANPYPIQLRDYDRTYTAAIAVLRDNGFRIDRQDYRFGRLTTIPLGSPTIAEPWHRHNSTTAQAWHSTLSDLQRRVTVFLEPVHRDERPEAVPHEPAEEGLGRSATQELGANELPSAVWPTRLPPPQGYEPPDSAAHAYRLRIEVVLESRQLPTRLMIGSAASSVFRRLEDTPSEWKRRGITQGYWLPIGRDPKLEGRLVHKIIERAASNSD